MYTYEVMYSRLGEDREIVRLICLGTSPRNKPILTDNVFAICMFTSDEPIDQVYAKYFADVKSRMAKRYDKRGNSYVYEPVSEKYVSAIYLASGGNYNYIAAFEPDYVVPYFSSGRMISDIEIEKFFRNFPSGTYLSPRKLLDKYEVIII